MKWLSANHWENKWFSIPSDLPKNLAVCGQQGKLVTTHIITWVWSVHSHPLSVFLPDFFTFMISFPPHQHFYWLQNFLPQDYQNCSQKIINDFHVATSDNQFSVIVLRIDLWAAFILVNHTLLFHILSSMGNTATWFFPYLDDLYIGSSSFPYFWMWITQGLHLWLLSYLHSQPTWPHPLPKVLHIILIPPSENVYLQSKTFSWTLDLNIQLPTWFLHFDVYEASQT